MVEADPDQIHQIFVNLLVNAGRYGTPPIRVQIENDDSYVTARVSDQGDGVPVEFVPHLFDSFTQATNARTGQGSGLGLAIVKGLVDTAGGEVWYENLQPRGACFVIRFHRFREPHGERLVHALSPKPVAGLAKNGRIDAITNR